jgi:hypothetical protein
MMLRLRSGDKEVVRIERGTLAKQITREDVNVAFREYSRAAVFEGKYYLILQFEELLDTRTRIRMSAEGIYFHEYVPDNAYLISLPADVDVSLLISDGLLGYYRPTERDKVPDYFYGFLNGAQSDGTIQIRARLMGHTSSGTLDSALSALPGGPQASIKDNHRYFTSDMNRQAILELARLPFIYYIEPHSDQVTLDCQPPLSRNYDERFKRGDYHTTSSRANYIKSVLPGHLGLNGDGVFVGVGDAPYWTDTHIDMQGRHQVLDPDAYWHSNTNHGIHTSGTVGGNGTRIPRFEGLAPRAFVYTAETRSIFDLGFQESNPMVISSNSWTSSDPVYWEDWYENKGRYNIYSQEMDQLAGEKLSFISIHSAGNSGGEHDGFPNGYSLINPGHASAKNTMAIGRKGMPESFGTVPSYGPTRDGRIKPELISENNVTATIENDDYAIKQGSSMSTPTVAGIAALLYQRFRQLNAGDDPEGGLVKAILANSADYLTTPGPTFSAGFGKVNARRAVEIVNGQQYEIDSLGHSEVRTFFIDVPASTDGKTIASMKVMLYWTDREASLYASPALVSNLDLSVTSGATTFLPWVLDPTPANVELPAVRGVDNLNNIEQVTIDLPAAGSYEIHVYGKVVPLAPQKFYVVYSYILDELLLTFPIGEEKLFSGETRSVFWDSHNIGEDNAVDAVEYSTDGGVDWSPVTHDSLGAWAGSCALWKVPEMPLSSVVVRISMNGQTSTSDPFTVSERIEMTMIELNEEEVELSWNAVTGADSYDLLRLVSDTLWESFFETSDTTVVVEKSSVSLDETWISAQAVDSAQNLRSQRAEAIDFDFMNSWPVAADDTIEVATFPSYLLIYPLDNDLDSDGDGIYVSDVSTPDHGTATNCMGRSIRYKADSSFVDSDMFTYTICDGRHGADDATICIRMATGSVQEEDDGSVPGKFALEQNYPNPFNPETQVHYFVPQACHVSLEIFNILGQKIRTLVDELETAGGKRVNWDGKDEGGDQVASGVYLCRLKAGDLTETKKMVLIR